MTKPNDSLWRPCANDTCLRQAAAGEPLCETCALERSLYRRAERSPRADARDSVSSHPVPWRSVESPAS